jgi:hypothetical protein
MDDETARDVLRQRQPAANSAHTETLDLVHGVVTDQAADTESLLAALTVLRHLRQELASWEPQLIATARQHGTSWARLAPALGVTSRQAAERRYLRLQPSATGGSTGEGRVRATRDKRAGDRAVEAWARKNSTVLRQLAGQVSALDGLSGPARRHADLIGQALAGSDPATLLSPLADSQPHLRTTHAGLAKKIKSVMDQTEQLRRHTQHERSALHPAKPPA